MAIKIHANVVVQLFYVWTKKDKSPAAAKKEFKGFIVPRI
jgi:hypothetical protein